MYVCTWLDGREQGQQFHVDVYRAVERLPEFIEKCVQMLNQVEGRDYAQAQISVDLHTFGINVRYLGEVRQRVRNDAMRKRLLVEAVARVIKVGALEEGGCRPGIGADRWRGSSCWSCRAQNDLMMEMRQHNSRGGALGPITACVASFLSRTFAWYGASNPLAEAALSPRSDAPSVTSRAVRRRYVSQSRLCRSRESGF